MTRHARSSWNLKVLGLAFLFLGATGAESIATSVPSSGIASTAIAQAHTSHAATSTSTSPETCRSATVNHITNRLPQQCWAGSTSAAATTAGASGASASPDAISTADTQHGPVQYTKVHSDQERTLSTGSSPPPEANVAQHTATAASAITDASSTSSSAVAVESSILVESETESPLDNAEFLSFEEWKKKKLAQAGEGANALAQERKNFAQDRQQPGINNALDTFGDDSEIAFDFNPFGGPNEPGDQPSHAATGRTSTASGHADAAPPASHKRSKDAGKTCKERSNFASFDCAANVLKTNPKCKSASSILVENKDSYMLNECATDNKFLIVELCETVLIDTIVLANFEFFSSMFRTFRISAASKYPPKPDEWKHIGTFEARNSRDIQPFLVEHPMFARYLRVEFLSHYGSEYYCPVSLLRVHGLTMYEDYLHDDQGREHGDDGEEANNSQAALEETKDTVTVVSEIKEIHTVATGAVSGPKGERLDSSPQLSSPASSATPAEQISSASNSPSATAQADMCISTAHPRPETVRFATPDKCAVDSTPPKPSTKGEVASTHPTSTSSIKSAVKSTESLTPSASPTSTSVTLSAGPSKNSSGSVTNASSNATEVVTTTLKKPESPVTSIRATSSALTATPNTVPAAPPAPPAYPPPTQESFFKSIHKRLQALEANATLSLQYIESQSALLRDAFAKVEKRQLGKTATFLETLNQTVTSELARFKGDYDQLWHSAVMELAGQREEGRRERELLGERIKVLAEEMVNQKRLMAAQATLLLLCLGLVVFGKLGGVGPAVDSGLLQGMQEIVMKAKEAKLQESGKAMRAWSYDSPWSTPSTRRKDSPGEGHQENMEPELRERTNQNGGLGIEKVNVADDRRRSLALQPQELHNAGALSVRSAPTTPGT